MGDKIQVERRIILKGFLIDNVGSVGWIQFIWRSNGLSTIRQWRWQSCRPFELLSDIQDWFIYIIILRITTIDLTADNELFMKLSVFMKPVLNHGVRNEIFLTTEKHVVQDFPCCFYEIQFNTSLPLTRRSTRGFAPFFSSYFPCLEAGSLVPAPA